MKNLLMFVTLVLLPAFSLADTQGDAVSVAVKRLEQNGQLTDIAPDEDIVKWLRETIDAGTARLAKELPAILRDHQMTIELVSVPHPEIEGPVNKLFVQSKKEFNPARLLPFVSRMVENKLDVYVALEARVTTGNTTNIFVGQAHTAAGYKKGLQLSSAYLETLEEAGRASFEAAIDKVISEAKTWAEANPQVVATAQPS